jgi:hypothetical protein
MVDTINIPISDGTDINIALTGTNNPESFLALTDTPDSYVGKGSNFVVVKSTEDGLEFSTSSTSVNWGGIFGSISNQGDLTTALGLKEDVSNKSTNTSLGTSNTSYPSQNAVKTYVDNSVLNLEDSNGNIYVLAGNKIYLDKVSNTYFIYQNSELELFVGGVIRAAWG